MQGIVYYKRKLKESLSMKGKVENLYVFFNLKLYYHQKEILEDLNLEREEYGSYKTPVIAATGTGKTITSLFLATKVYEKLSRLCIIIVCPYQHLVNQCDDEARKFNIKSILCFASKATWQPILKEEINSFNMKISSCLCIITTNNTFCTLSFSEMLQSINNPSLIILDEAHHIGTENFEKYLPQNIKLRLGLSATPEKWMDDNGNNIINKYFKNGVVYRYPLEKAIGSFLTEYYYYPHIVYFTDEESEKYLKLSAKINKYFSIDEAERTFEDN